MGSLQMIPSQESAVLEPKKLPCGVERHDLLKGFTCPPLEEAVLHHPAGISIQTHSQSPQAEAELPMLFSKSQLKSLETPPRFSAQSALFTAQNFTKKLSEKNSTTL